MMVKRTERGWAGHYICCHQCLFRRNTLLELGDVQIVVSTVGAKRNPRTGNVDEVGLGRYYETMAFHAYRDGAYMEANIERQVSFSSPWHLDKWDADDIDMQANDMHEAVVAEIAERMLSGKVVQS